MRIGTTSASLQTLHLSGPHPRPGEGILPFSEFRGALPKVVEGQEGEGSLGPRKRPNTGRQHRSHSRTKGRGRRDPFHISVTGTHASQPQKQVQVLMLGLDGSGKTSLLYKLKYNENVVTVPTAGFTVESLEIDGKSPELTVWDVGGQRKMRPHWRHYYYETAGLMFAVDSQNERRLDEARKELHRVLRQDSLRGVPLVVLANKQALPDALSPQSLSVKLDLRGGVAGRAWFVQPSSANTGTGLEEGFMRTVYLMKTPFRQTQDDIKVQMRSKGFGFAAVKRFCGS
ncbi:LOW QUALITY PROTEIN: ADP-ribosylation factor 6 [Nothobranchius furzeri]|uniref:LOW QUALITY PROTEIN: ADP-ribosylation factor 6 n=1 Tax=Nothobranchius furzeri TaxID=105023 RepID=UPI003904C83F